MGLLDLVCGGISYENYTGYKYGYLSGSDILQSMSSFIFPNYTAASGWNRAYEPSRDLITTVSNTFGAAIISAFGYENDGLGRRTARVDTMPSPSLTVNNAFGYNVKSEVTSATMANGESIYDYDSIGNRLFAALDAATNSYTANAMNQYSAITDPVNTVNPVYDLDGNIITNGVWSFRWDAENRMVAAYSNDELLVVNAYDDQSRRIRKMTAQGTRTFLYDGWNPLREVRVQGSGGSTNYYCWGTDLSGTMQGAGGVGGLLAVYTVNAGTTSTYYPCYDANGNITEYVDESGVVRAEYAFDAFGQTISQSGDMASTFSHRFSTKYADDETGLYYYGYRYYAPGLGRWVSRDPIEEQGGVHVYGFVGNNPDNLFDLLGLTNEPGGFPYDPFWGHYPPTCGNAEVGRSLDKVLNDFDDAFSRYPDKCKLCSDIHKITWTDWDITLLAAVGKDERKGHFPGNVYASTGGPSPCDRTVQVHGKCYYGGAVNYALFGRGFRLCEKYNPKATLAAAQRKVSLYKGVRYFGALSSESNEFVKFGFSGATVPSSGGCASCYLPAGIVVNVGKWHFTDKIQHK